MVNVDFANPSLILGAALIGCGVLLLQLRNMQNQISRDADIVVAAMVSIVGSTLIFQGWRLDPLLLLCQALTTSVAFWYGLETFRLRTKEFDAQRTLLPPAEEPAQAAEPRYNSVQFQPPPQAPPQPQLYDVGAAFERGQAGFLPAGISPARAFPWLQQQQPARQQQQQSEGRGYYEGGRWPDDGSNGGNASSSGGGEQAYPYETLQYDFYGNPVPTAQQQQQAQQQMPRYGAATASYGGYDRGGGGAGPSGNGQPGSGYDAASSGMSYYPGEASSSFYYPDDTQQGGRFDATTSQQWQAQPQASYEAAYDGGYEGVYGGSSSSSDSGSASMQGGSSGEAYPQQQGQQRQVQQQPGGVRMLRGGHSGPRVEVVERVDDWE